MQQRLVGRDEAAEIETSDAKARRLAREAELIEEARRDLDAGHGISGRELEEWLERFVRGDLPLDPDMPDRR